MKLFNDIYNNIISKDIKTAVLILTVISVIISIIVTLILVVLLDLTFGQSTTNYFTSIFLALIIPSIATPLISKKIIHLSNKLKSANEKLYHHAEYDALTHIYSKRHMLELAKYEFALSKRDKTPISTLLIDYDNLKEINKKYGRKIGDIVLVELARTISSSIRDTDIFGRYNGKTFLIICPDIDMDTTEKFAQKIRNIVNKHIHINDYDINMSISIGCSGLKDSQNSNLSLLIEDAHKALEIAKKQL